jgi:hypothetical protein
MISISIIRSNERAWRRGVVDVARWLTSDLSMHTATAVQTPSREVAICLAAMMTDMHKVGSALQKGADSGKTQGNANMLTVVRYHLMEDRPSLHEGQPAMVKGEPVYVILDQATHRAYFRCYLDQDDARRAAKLIEADITRGMYSLLKTDFLDDWEFTEHVAQVQWYKAKA